MSIAKGFAGRLVGRLARAWRRHRYSREWRQYWMGRNFMEAVLEDPIRAEMQRRETAVLLERILQLRPHAVLDVGCAFGRVVKALAEAGIDRVVGVDISPLALQQAQGYIGDAPNVKLLQADAERLPFKSHSFDVVFTRSVMSHIPPRQADRARLELARVCKGYVLHLESEYGGKHPDTAFSYSNGDAYQALGFRDVTRESCLAHMDRMFTVVRSASRSA